MDNNRKKKYDECVDLIERVFETMNLHFVMAPPELIDSLSAKEIVSNILTAEDMYMNTSDADMRPVLREAGLSDDEIDEMLQARRSENMDRAAAIIETPVSSITTVEELPKTAEILKLESNELKKKGMLH